MIETGNGLDLDWSETRKSLGLPSKKGSYRYCKDPMFEKIGANLAVIDYQQFLTRFKWHNLPEGMDSELIERVLYFSGSAMFFRIKELNRFYFLPYGMCNEGTQKGINTIASRYQKQDKKKREQDMLSQVESNLGGNV